MLPRFVNRRELFVQGGLLAALFPSLAQRRAQAAALRIGNDIFQSIGVKPIVNCKGTFTIISGSQSLPEVKAAMDAASRHYVHLDELMDAVGRRLAELTKAEWGMVSSGCAAALAHSAAACMAGADPEKMQRLPDTRGLKNEVISPTYSRNVYDHAIRGAGAKFIDVRTVDEFRRAFNERTAMVMILASPPDSGEMGLQVLAPIAKQHGVPVLVDAAAEKLTIPNVHLSRGADLVAYSGGKCLRGPQSAGLLLGRKDLVQTAWLHAAPHHAFGRPMKADKEAIMGMLAAVEMWVKRDHDAEWKQWEGWLATIADSVKRVPGVTTEVRQPEGLSNHAPRLSIHWDGDAMGLAGREVEKALLDGDPRVILGGASGDRRSGMKRSSLTVMPYMMMPGDAEIAARRLYEVMTQHPKKPMQSRAAPSVNVAGQWDVDVEFLTGKAQHGFVFEQKGADLVGSHTGEFLGGDLRGSVEGDEVYIRTSHRYEGTRLGYEFTGKVSGDTIAGTVDLGEYGQAKWSAHRHKYDEAGGIVRPIKNV
ncbi:MAG: aminotransferase class V-fold PLP-dependent enzyme [Bryobacteraceae bacterium]